MNDTQWPRFEVFQQDQDGRPHQNAGSVHAPDGEIALQYARDVFVRRPQCISMWVVPAEAIFAKTAQELEAEPLWQESTSESRTAVETYYVFQKVSQRRSMTYVRHVGQVEATSPVQALQRALGRYGHSESYVWWVCPEAAIVKSNMDDVQSMFAPSLDKTYRMPQEYRVMREMLEATSEQMKTEEE